MSLGTSFKRVFRNAFQSFWRNGLVSVATVLVMIVALFMIGSLFLFNVLLNSTIAQVQEKVDVSVYFKTDAQEAEIVRIQELVKGFPEVAAVEYVSREQALENFKKRHEGNSLIASALDELPDNPLGASLRVRAKNPNDYERIASALEGQNSSAIDKVNYKQNQRVFERLATVLTVSRQVGVGVSIVLAIIAILVAFNTVRLAIFTARDEIGIMRLVGASSWYIRGPFLVEGMIHGFFAAVITTILFWPITLWAGPKAKEFFGGTDLFQYFVSNLPQFFLTLLLFAVSLGVISSFIATRRYLKV